ncbi:MAG: hypothetical protein K8R18_13100 [Parvibaculum sp.]|uniref:hypothetical protein n=1 Tax=Parvibaculum sp. TaxID=2024848 RepID=UPI0025D4D5C6|nr:hypothetical protein [Parvibaculum sp.]MCE9650553.1 hypothetical protein [Parvibaculum sp.]
MDSKPGSALAERLSNLLSRLAPATAKKLATGLEREKLQGTDGLPYGLILTSLRPALERGGGPRPGMPDPLRQFCLPFEDLLVNARDATRHTRQIARTSIDPVWFWLTTELLPDTLPDITGRLVEHTLSGDRIAHGGALAILHATCSAALLSGLDAARRDVAQRRKLERLLGGDAMIEDARFMAEALAVAPFMMELHNELPRRIDDFDDGLVAKVSELYEDARDASPECAIYVPLAAMNRLTSPWQILRLARKLSGFGNDAAVSRSGLAALGEIFLREMEAIAAGFETKRPGKADLERMRAGVLRFAEISQGFVHEIDIRRISDWGHRILASRARLSATITEEMSRFEQDIAKALPLHQIGVYGKNGPRRPDATQAPNAERVARAQACLQFLTGVCPVSESIGVQAHCKTITQQVETYLVAYEDGLIEEIRRARDKERANALAYLEVVADFRETLGPDAAAATLRRRGKVAAQAVS